MNTRIKKCWIIVIFVLTFSFSLAQKDARACRFWAGLTTQMSKGIMLDMTGHLVRDPNSLKSLGDQHDDGWAIGYYSSQQEEPTVLRGADSSSEDPDFDHAAYEATGVDAKVVVAHIRKATSGCVEEVPNPHPFKRFKDNRNWLLGHNGGIRKETLIDLIGPEYLDENPPTTCTYDPPDSWVDSELYMIFLIKRIEENDWNVEQGLQKGLQELFAATREERKALNFFLTDGQTIWAFRHGPSLYYHFQEKNSYSAVSSEPPKENDDRWRAIQDDTLVVLKPDIAPQFVTLNLER